MDLRKLRYFIAVAEEEHIGRAAMLLNISQPPLTRQIHQLEEELGVALFNRTPKGMEITEAGAMFLDEAKNIFALVEQATERTQRAGAGRLGRLDVAIFGSGILETIPKVLLAFRQRFPDVKVVLHTMDKAAQIEALRQRRITVGFNRLLSPLPDIASEVVTSENLLLVVNDSHPFSKQQCVDFNDLKAQPLILFPNQGRPNFIDRVNKLCQEAGFTPTVSQEVNDAVTAVALVASGFGVCILPESATALQLPGVSYVPLTNMPMDSKVDLSCIYRDNDKSPLLKSFLTVVREFKKAQAE
ncbi:LysR substrate-binding domain-containing protein [Neptuniibacter sp. CAU 1671]|uniref:LysR substrate-binding domain-containing protein n=1 Tax=Neptuniibacter sp. CAU 1671 TaxID=3032593 RepID=UPI0023DBABB4|nr:LysR substrate-binding domain-containing protein [Neptuniibacter sp. CAU 1671]MDF2180534.1 LysR substrate-binding domain-containing protein [Neptuniibacter sp. CAU 1671]